MKNREVKKKKPDDAVNPFDIRINRQKHKILGRRVMKWEVGKPLQSRHAGIKKRRETLLPEFRNLNKSGKGVIDQRGGLTSRKAKLYQNVAIDDQRETNLTHKGEQLDDERLNQPVKDDDDDEEFDLLRRGDYVEVAHFGGGESGAPLSSEDFLQQVMVDKRQKQVEKEENIKLTEELDKNWSTIRNLIKHKGAKDESNMAETEDYDIFLNQLMFGSDDQKATVSTVKLTCEGVKEADKTPSPNVLIIDYLQNIMTTDDVEIILKQIDNLLSIEVKRLNSTVVKKAFNLLKAPEMRKCSLKSLGILMFLLTFVELKQQVLLKLINFLRVLKYGSIDEIAKRLLVCDVLHSSFPDHFFPEIISSLQNILILFEPVYASVFIPSFSFEKIASSEILCWSENMDFDDLPEFTFRTVFKDEISSCSKRKSVIFTAVINLVEKIHAKYSTLDASQAIFSRMMPILVNLQEKFTEPMSQRLFGLIENLNNSKQLHFLAFERKKPVMLKMLDPRIGDSRRRDDKKKLQRVVKREFKSAARELRKDGAFIRDIVLKDTIAKDEARKRKVKKLMSEIAQERSMFKKAR